ncbi:glycoside hydrolase family 13 protein [Nocardioides limicola]|uniref:glycoside hydrolase family 13 protein n=1 Tax=Nocardioides limicola TaxID=2803368 RepID=UPI00193B2034|nr:glycoside hydrolase family 13 protein [Nocardioides sp. DJM-14]
MTRPGLADPHHDGSPLYVDTQTPDLGDRIGLRVWVPHRADGSPAATTVVLRSVRDGEPCVTAAVCATTEAAGAWWSAELELHNPVTSYRFLLVDAEGGFRWLNGSGVHRRDVTDAADFRINTTHRLPDWVLDQVGYQIFPDRFARGGAAPPAPDWAHVAGWDDPVVHQGPDVPFQWYGGTLAGIRDHLDHPAGLGATLLYLTPVFEARSNHRYDAVSFDRVDPVLGGDEALEALVASAHDRGLRVVGDLTTNHTGDGHDWFLRARQDPDSVEASFYYLREDGEGYESWLDIPSLPKLNHASPELRARLYDGDRSVVARWLERGLDGWRIDVANMTGRFRDDDFAHDVARTLRATATATRPDAWVLAEHGHDATLDLHGAGWHGTMDYAGFTRPLWCWLNGGAPHGPGHPHGLNYLGLPVDIPVLDGDAAVQTMREVHGAMSWQAWTSSTSHLDSHDTPRFRTVTGGGTDGWIDRDGVGRDRHLLGLALQMTMPGVPVVFMGDELGLTGLDGEHARTPFPWERAAEWDHATLTAYRTWVALRRDNVALRRGGMRWVDVQADSMTFLREHPAQRLLVHVARAPHDPVRLPAWRLGVDSARQVTPLSPESSRPQDEPGELVLPGGGPAAHVYAIG